MKNELTALLSVSDKTGVLEFAQALSNILLGLFEYFQN